jgi:ATP-binding cassette subfamily C protein LapB
LVNNLKEFLQDKTLILITHRPLLLALVDRIIVMDMGKIIMDGTKDEVLKKISTPSPLTPKPTSIQGSRWA